MVRLLPLLPLLFLSALVSAQVMVDRPVLLTAPMPEDRQITGLPDTVRNDAVLTAATERKGHYRLASPGTGNVWSITLDALTTAPVAGTHLVVIAPPPTSGDVDLLVNGHGPYALLASAGVRAAGDAIPAGTALSVVMDGTAFQILNTDVRPLRPCPEGTVAVNDRLCIEVAEHGAVDFFAAAGTCGTQGMRLCGWGEFVVACQQADAIGMLNVADNWEWTNDASNENNCARVVGAGSCLSAGNAFVTENIPRAFRCCYTR